MGFKKNIFHVWINTFGWKTTRKLILFQSDDWGSQRMPSKEVYNILNNNINNLKLHSCAYSLYDSLEDYTDVENLLNTLNKFKDNNGSSPCFTLNFLTANPDFSRIAENNFDSYFHMDLDTSYGKYGDSPKMLLFKGIKNGLIEAQFHGREHLNTTSWLELLKKNKDIRSAAESGFYFLSFANLKSLNIPYLASFIMYGEQSVKNQTNVFNEGLELFESFFAFKATSFIAPVYVMNAHLMEDLRISSIKSIQGLYREVEMSSSGIISQGKRRSVLNENRQINLIRNCFFEPSLNASKDWVNEVLKEIEIAFRLNKPAIICTHRLNYIGKLDKKNASKNLILLEDLISKILKKWHDAEFINTEKLSNLISSDSNVL